MQRNYFRHLMKGFGLFLFFLFFCFSLHAQINIRGNVLDNEFLPLPGARVWIHEINKGTLTDIQGNFQISVSKKGFYHLHVSFLGFKTEVVNLNLAKDTTLKVILSKSELELKDVVIESDMHKVQLQESSQDIVVITKAQILQKSYDNLLKSMDRIPGFNTINIGVGAAKPIIRGLSFNRVVVANNGIKQEGQQWGGDHGLEIDPFNFDEIELLKGPAALFYGSDAIGGVLHIKNQMPPDSFHLAFNAGYRSNNQSIFQSIFASYRKKQFSIQARNTFQSYGDYGVPSDSFVYNGYILPIEQQKLKNTSGKEWNQMIRLGWQAEWGNSFLTVSNVYQNLGFFPGAFGIPTAYSVAQDGNFRDIRLPNQRILHTKIQTNHKILIGKHWLEADLAWQRNDRKEFSKAHSHGQNSADSLALGLNLETFQWNNRFWVNLYNWKWVMGASALLQWNQKSGFEYLIPIFQRTQVGVFQFVQWKKEKIFTMNAGVRLDIAKDQLDEAYVDVYRRKILIGKELRTPLIRREYWNYSVSVGTSWNPYEFLNLKWNLGTDFRYPAPNELASNGVHHGTFRHEQGNPNLNPEKGYQADFALHFEKKIFEIRASAFYSFFQDYIYLSPTSRFSTLPEGGQVYQYLQNDATLLGGELMADYHFLPNFHCSVAADYVRGNLYNSYLPLPFMPQPSILTHLEYSKDFKGKNWKKIQFWIENRVYFAQNRVVRNEPETPSSLLFHTGVSTNFHFQKHQIELSIQVQNLTNQKYFYHLSKYRYLNLYEPARNFVLSVNYQW